MPMQHWFFEQAPAGAHHFNQSLMFEVRAALDSASLKRAVGAVIAHHDSLRMTFAGSSQRYGAASVDDAVVEVDLSALPENEQSQATEQRAAELQASLVLEKGRLLKVVHFNLGPNVNPRLLVIVHHLVTDGVSWRVLLEDLERAYGQVATGRK